MKTQKIIEEMAFELAEELGRDEEYKEINSKIIELQKQLKSELSESGFKILMELSSLEAETEAFTIDYVCYKAFLQGIALGQAVEANKTIGGCER